MLCRWLYRLKRYRWWPAKRFVDAMPSRTRAAQMTHLASDARGVAPGHRQRRRRSCASLDIKVNGTASQDRAGGPIKLGYACREHALPVAVLSGVTVRTSRLLLER